MTTNKRIDDKNIADSIKFKNTNYITYENELAVLKDTFTNLLDDYNRYTLMTRNFPSNAEYKRMYLSVKLNIQNIFSALFQMSNKIDTENTDVLNNISQVKVFIAGEKDLSDELEENINDRDTNERSSSALKSDYTIINYQELYILLALIFSIISIVINGIIINQYYKIPK